MSGLEVSVEKMPAPIPFFKDWKFNKRWMGFVVDFDPTKVKETRPDVYVSSRVGEGEKKNVYVLTKVREDEDDEYRDVFECEGEKVHLACLMDDGRVKWRADKFMIAYYIKNEGTPEVAGLAEELLAAARHFAVAGNV